MTEDVLSQTVSEPGKGARGARSPDPDTVIKGLAKSLAKDATSQISDRHLRASVRTSCYNQIVNVLGRWDNQRSLQQARYRRTITILGSTTILMGAALALSLAF